LTTSFPVRTKKKAESRARLVRAAQELFATQGYHQTKLEDVAERAGLHVQTLYRHFATKEDLANAGERFYLERFRAFISSPDRTDDTFSRWREWIELSNNELITDKNHHGYREHLQLRASSYSVLGSLWAIQAEYEQLLTESLAIDFNLPAEGCSTPRLVAGMLLAGHGYVVRRYELQEIDYKTECLEAVDSVRALFAHLIVADGLKERHQALIEAN